MRPFLAGIGTASEGLIGRTGLKNCVRKDSVPMTNALPSSMRNKESRLQNSAARRTAAETTPLVRALASEVGRLEALRVRSWLGVSAAITVGSCLQVLTRPGHTTVGIAIGLFCAAWFAWVDRELRRGRWRAPYAWGTVAVEQLLPPLLLAALALRVSPLYAAVSRVHIIIYCGSLIIGILRLNPNYSLASSGFAFFSYLAVAQVIILPGLSSALPQELDRSTAAQFIQATYLVFAGLVAAIVAMGLRNAVGGVVRTVRADELFGKYHLERELASGGMGTVWLAKYCPEGGFERPVAVKMIHPQLARISSFVDSFRAEAALSARLVHQHIVQVFDFGRVDDRYFLAMEYVEGVTLRDLMARSTNARVNFPEPVVGAIGRAILAGLAFAHEEARDKDGALLRVIHRDLAPSNILVSKGGAVKITDFGIARALGDDEETHTEHIMGHLDHMAPEQLRTGVLDARTDLYCVGILIWEMLLLRRLYRRPSRAAIMHAIAHEDAPLPSTIDGALVRWDSFFRKALARDPEQRFQSARDMGQALYEIAGECGEEAISQFALSVSHHELVDGADAATDIVTRTANDQSTWLRTADERAGANS